MNTPNPSFTPGPWIYQFNSDQRGPFLHSYLIETQSRVITRLPTGNSEEDNANAHLIAAAPDLFAALAAIINPVNGHWVVSEQGRLNALAALAKAHGGTP